MFSSGGYVTNLQPLFLTNFNDFVLRCEAKDLYIYYCLFSFMSWQYFDIVTNTTARSSYINNAVKPFIQRYKDSPSFLAVDIMNEPESGVIGSTGNWSAQGTTWDRMRTFISDCVAGI